MQVLFKREYKVTAAVGAGVLVWLASSLADLALLPLDPILLPRKIVANVIGGLMAVVVSLILQLRSEEVQNRVTLERAAIIAELNHHIRNAVFPLRIVVQSLGNAEANKTADDAMERINIALRDATADALAGKVHYSAPESSGRALA